MFTERDSSSHMSYSGHNPVGALKEQSQRLGAVPCYELVSAEGPPHSPVFSIQVCLSVGGHRIVGRGQGGSKKEAKEIAARKALHLMQAR